jgi:metal-responsive CopG/Arc/MetJ family transcriptional regulator
MHSRRVKISVSLPRDLVARIDRTAKVEARSRSRVLEGWLNATARETAAREVEAATVEYYESLTAAHRREDEAMAASSSAAARRLRIDEPPAARSRHPQRRPRRP